MFFKKWKEQTKKELIKHIREDVYTLAKKGISDIISKITYGNGVNLTSDYTREMSDLSEIFKTAVETQIHKYTNNINSQINSQINSAIYSEQFIDALVERILKKQLIK